MMGSGIAASTAESTPAKSRPVKADFVLSPTTPLQAYSTTCDNRSSETPPPRKRRLCQDGQDEMQDETDLPNSDLHTLPDCSNKKQHKKIFSGHNEEKRHLDLPPLQALKAKEFASHAAGTKLGLMCADDFERSLFCDETDCEGKWEGKGVVVTTQCFDNNRIKICPVARKGFTRVPSLSQWMSRVVCTGEAEIPAKCTRARVISIGELAAMGDAQGKESLLDKCIRNVDEAGKTDVPAWSDSDDDSLEPTSLASDTEDGKESSSELVASLYKSFCDTRMGACAALPEDVMLAFGNLCVRAASDRLRSMGVHNQTFSFF